MEFQKWKAKLDGLELTCNQARKIYEEACEDRDAFLISTLGFKPSGVATLVGTAEMISRIVDMKAEEKAGKT